MEILPYHNEDHFNACMAIFDSNCPDYFLPEERPEFKDWLTNKKEPYWVLVNQGEVIACGGIYRAEEHTNSSAEFYNEVGFAWGMVHNKHHKKGYGKLLGKYRVDYLKDHFSNRPIVLRTSQFTHQFFEKLDFKVIEYIKDGWAEGMDKVIMVYGN